MRNIVKFLGGMVLFIGATGLVFAEDKDNENEPDTCIAPTPGGGSQQATYFGTSDRTAGAKYRKIGLNGFPIPDEKPQQTGETDAAKEETYIDAFTTTLSHQTTDIYIPFEGTDLTLSVRRNWIQEVGRSDDMLPTARIDRPFGVGWTTNIMPTIEVTYPPTGLPSVVVTDENGSSYRFKMMPVLVTATSAEIKFFPMPTNRHQMEVMATSLKQIDTPEGKRMVFKKKFGTQLTFRYIPSNEGGRVAIAPYWDVTRPTVHYFGVADKIEDRLGNTINYSYEPGSWIPNQIEFRGKTLTITSSGNRIQTITDPNGNVITYGQSGYYLNTVTKPLGSITRYTYQQASPPAPDPQAQQDGHTVNIIYWDLKTITDPNNKVYTFDYDLDTTHRCTDSRIGTYTNSSTPRVVTAVTLPITDPGNTPVKTLFDNTGMLLQMGPTIESGLAYLSGKTKVTDANGGKWEYIFSDPDVEELSSLAQAFNIDLPTPMHISNNFLYVFKKMTVVTPPALVSPPPADITPFTMEATFNKEAGMALASFRDVSCTVATTYAYTENFNFAEFQPWIVDPTKNVTAFIKTKYWGDPTSQTNGLGKTKSFEYHSKWRVMNKVTDELGRVTEYTIDPLNGNRLAEIIRKPGVGGEIQQRTDFEYGNSAFPGVITKKTVKKVTRVGNADPTWATDLVTEYELDTYGNIKVEKVTSGATIISKTEYTYDANNNKKTTKVWTKTTSPEVAYTTSFDYDALNRLTKVTYPNGTGQKVYTYDLASNKLSERDKAVVDTANSDADHVKLWEYDALNRVVKEAQNMNAGSTINAGDLVITTTYNKLNAKLSVQTPRGNTTVMEYDKLNRLTKKTDPVLTGATTGYETTFEYGANCGGLQFGRDFMPTKVTDVSRAFSKITTYDAALRPTQTQVEYQTGVFATTQTAYDDVGNVTQVTDSLGKITKTEYDELNRPTKTTFAFSTGDQANIQTRYTSTGLMWQVTDQRGYATETEYDAAGRPIKVKSPDVLYGLADTNGNAITETRYDAAGNVVKTINPLLKEWDYEYDARNRKTKELRPLNASSVRPTYETQYDIFGNVKKTIGARGNATTGCTDMAYDLANRLLTTTSPTVNIYTTLDLPGRPVTTNEYDADGNITKVIDANTHQTVNTYDEMGRLKTVRSVIGTLDAGAGDDIIVTYDYDSVGNRISVKDGLNQQTTFEYDGLNRNTKITDPANRSTSFTFDAVNKTERVDAANRHTLYTYDNLHRLKTVTYKDSGGVTQTGQNSPRTYSYDLSGNLTSVVETSKSKADVSYTYDALNRVRTETSSALTHTYRYDLASNRIQAAYGTGITLVSTYDEQNRLKSLTEGTRVTNYEYDLDGNETKKTFPSGEMATTSYDLLNRKTLLQSTRSTNGLIQDNHELHYDALGNMRGSVDVMGGHMSMNRVVKIAYDDANRMIQEQISSGSTTPTTNFVYDKAHNLTSMSGATNRTLNYNNLNQLTSFTEGGATVSFVYDNNGNRFSKEDQRLSSTNPIKTVYGYDYENRLITLVRMKASPSTTYTFTYDYRSRRVERNRVKSGTGDPLDNIASGTDKVVFSGGTSVREINAVNGNTLVDYMRGSDWGGGVGSIIYTLRGSTVSMMHYNQRGDVTMRTNASQNDTYNATYSAFGGRTQEAGTNTDRQQSNTKDEDVVGYANEGFRFRDIENGMFISRDPLGFVDGPNMYTYVNQNPWTSFDPEGLKTKEDYRDDIRNLRKERRDAMREARKQGLSGKQQWAVGRGFDMKIDAAQSAIAGIESTARSMEYTMRAATGSIDSEALNDSDDAYKSYKGIQTALSFWPGAGAAEHASNGEYGRAAGSFALDVGLTMVGGKLVKGGVQAAGSEVGTGISVASGMGGEVLPMSVVKTLPRGTAGGIINEAKALTFSTGNEHALVRLATGERALVSGGPGGIAFTEGQVTRIIGHTHPYGTASVGPSTADKMALKSLGQTRSYIIEGGQTIRFGPN